MTTRTIRMTSHHALGALLLSLLIAAPAAAQEQPAAPNDPAAAASTQPGPQREFGGDRMRRDFPPGVGPGGPGGPRGAGGPGDLMGPGFRGGEGRFRGGGISPFDIEDEPDPEQWEAVAKFTEQHSPNRWKFFIGLPEDKRQGVRRVMYWRYLQMERLKDDHPEMYDLHVQRLAVEDAIFPLAWLIRRTPDGEQVQQVKTATDEMRTHVEKLVQIGLKERELRLVRMKQRLIDEEQQLSFERARVAEVVDHRMSEILRMRGGPWMGGEGTRRPYVGGPEGRAGEPVGPAPGTEPAPAPVPTPAPSQGP